MSQMKELYAKADVTLQEKFTDIIKNAEAAGKEETGAKLVAFAKEAGYDITTEEKPFFTDRQNGELDDAELEMVAGGKQSPGQWLDNTIGKLVDFGNDIHNAFDKVV